MTFLLDTNVVSELRKGARAHQRVAEWFAEANDQELCLSVLVVGEIRRGVEAIKQRDPAQSGAIERWLGTLVRDYGDRILPINRAVAEEWGRLTAVRSGSVVDTLLAATARVHHLTLVTRNVTHVAWTGVSCLNPFSGPTGRV